MTAFSWTDRKGGRHELDTPEPIKTEAAAIAQEIDAHVALLDSPDRMLRNPVRNVIRQLQRRLGRLRDDLAAWNDHAAAVNRAEAAKLAEQIDRLPAMIADITLVVALHDEQHRMMSVTSGAPETRAKVLAEPMTALQRRAIAAAGSRMALGEAATRGEAMAWLAAQPRFARSDQADGGWFSWVDRGEHAHRLLDPLMIEREVATVAKELASLRSAMTANNEPGALYAALDTASASWKRLFTLQQDLARYDREAEAREDAAWRDYAADWRLKRSKR